MTKVNEKSFLHYSMPIQDPLYTKGSIRFRADVLKGEFIVEKGDKIADIVPEPLIYRDNKIVIVLMMVKRLMEGFPQEYSLWNEIAVQIPVIHDGAPGLYVCENYTNDIGGIISGREIYGYPKMPGDITIKKTGMAFNAHISKYGTKECILETDFEYIEEIPRPEKPPSQGTAKKMPKVILFKVIPSATQSEIPDVKQLVAMIYGRPVMHKQMFGKGKIEIKGKALRYLQEAVISNKGKSVFSDMEIHLIGGEVIHNYL